ncbi:hypothetical protein I4U23_030933 [Adineta vaga]|nr:hypothetical protein I4U23_030933 [Adineta vaga]
MAVRENSLFVNNNDDVLEYYEEIDDHTLDFLNQNRRPSKTIIKPVREPTQIVDPIKQLNKELNRQYRPDLIVPTPTPSAESPVTVPFVPRTPTPDPVIFDARVKPVKPPEEKKEPSISVKHKLRDRIHQFTAPTPEPIPPTPSEFDQQNPFDTYQIPSGMVLVPASQQQQQMIRKTKPSQYPPPHPIVSEYKPPTVSHNASFKGNKVAPPPHPDYTTQRNYPNVPYKPTQRSPSLISTNPLMQSKSTSYLRAAQNATFQSKTNKNKSKKAADQDLMNNHRSFALYNQQNGRVEGIVKHHLNVASDEVDGSRIVDDATKPKSKLALWLSQPLCLGLKRLSGGLLFGSMILLGIASFAGLIASIATYSKDNVNDAQWKILGMVVCSIMLITIIVTLIVFICCFKYGYMFNKDEDIDPNDPSSTYDADGNERKKAVLRKIYKFNRPAETSSIPSGLQDVSTTASVSHPPVQVNDKQTNTEATIAPVRPIDFDRGVWPSKNAYGGLVYRPLIQPRMISRIVQVLPADFEEIIQPKQVIYQVVAPTATEIQPRYIELPERETSYVEVIETKPKQTRTIQQAPVIEVIETKQSYPRTTIVRPTQHQSMAVQPTTTRYEYVDVEEARTIRRKPPPQYEYVEESIDQSDASSVEEIVEIVDAPRHLRQQQRQQEQPQQEKRKETKKGFGNVLVKHVRATND